MSFLPRWARTQSMNQDIDDDSDLETAIELVKNIGRKHGGDYAEEDDQDGLNDTDLSVDIVIISQIMHQFKDNRHVQRVCAHALSNIAIDQSKCPAVIEQGLHNALEKAVERHMDDWKVCWLSMSAIWNLARPNDSREEFQDSIVNVVFKILKKWKNTPLVCETALGALSNLVLHEPFRDLCGSKLDRLKLMCQCIDKHRHQGNVATSSSGWITNMAHDNAIAQSLTEDCFAVPLILQLMSIHSHDTHLIRNCCAALSNLATADQFTTHLLCHSGIERLYSAINLASLNEGSQIEPLAEQALFAVDVDPSELRRLSSLHVAAQKGLVDCAYSCLKKDTEIHVLDSNGDTPLHHALLGRNAAMVKFLVTRGADLNFANKAGQTPNSFMIAVEKEITEGLEEYGISSIRKEELLALQKDFTLIQQAITDGENELKLARNFLSHVVYESKHQSINFDVCTVIAQFEDAFDAVETYLENKNQRKRKFGRRRKAASVSVLESSRIHPNPSATVPAYADDQSDMSEISVTGVSIRRFFRRGRTARSSM